MDGTSNKDQKGRLRKCKKAGKAHTGQKRQDKIDRTENLNRTVKTERARRTVGQHRQEIKDK